MDKWSNSIEEYSNAISEQEENSGKNTLEDYNSNNNGGTSKKKGLALKIIIGIVAVLLVGGIVVFSQPTLRNKVFLTVLSPKSYYYSIELRNVKNIADSIGNSYEERRKRLDSQKDGNISNKIGIKIDADESLTSELEIDDVLPFEFLIESSSNMVDGKKKMDIECKTGEEVLIGLNMLMNLDQEEYGDTYIQVPQFSSAYLYTSFAETEDSKTQSDMKRYQKIYTNYLNNPTSRKFLSNLIVRYGKLIIETPEEVSVEKNAQYSVNDVTKEMVKVTVSITDADAKVWCAKIVETAKKDDELKKELVRLGICEEENYPELVGKLEELFNEGEDDDSKKLVMDVWVDNIGKIVGREIYVTTDDKRETDFYYFMDNQDEIDHLEIGVYDLQDKETSITIKGNRKKEETGYKGGAVININSENDVTKSAKLTFDGVALVDKDYGSYNGNFMLESDMMADGKLQLTLAGEENKQNIKLEEIENNTSLFSVEINQAMEECEKIEYPPEGTIYDIQNTEDMEAYLTDMDEAALKAFGDRLKTFAATVSAISHNEEIQDDFTVTPSTEESEENIEKNPDKKDDKDTESTKDNGEIYIIKNPPKTAKDLPESVEVDEKGYYSYDVSDDVVKENGEASNVEATFSGILMEKNNNKIEKLVKSVAKVEWERTTDSRNIVYGSIGEYATLYTSFLTTDNWYARAKGNGGYYSLRISYDTYSNEISDVIISAPSVDETDKLVKGFLALWEEDAEKTYKEYKKQAKKVKNSDSEIFDAGITRIYYAPNKDSIYCNLSVIEE